jgi:acid phosphatase family membrane protein YuiD
MEVAENFTLVTRQLVAMFTFPVGRLILLTVSAQVASMILKLVIKIIRYKTVDPKSMFSYGGMPSSHTVFLTSFCFGVGLDPELGWFHPSFVLSLILASVIVVDTVRFRGTVDRLNDVVAKLVEKDKDLQQEVKMPRKIAHTYPEVLAGTVFALFYAALFYTVFYSVLSN